jgi:hypothetical protein
VGLAGTRFTEDAGEDTGAGLGTPEGRVECVEGALPTGDRAGAHDDIVVAPRDGCRRPFSPQLSLAT